MEECIAQLSQSAVSDIPNNPHAPFPYAELYKTATKIDSQEIRRETLLAKQKQNRESHIDQIRGLVGDNFKHKQKKYKGLPGYTASEFENILMLGEWLVDIPTDFEEKWTMIPCPVGNRRLIVASEGMSVAYTKTGTMCEKFPTLLPGTVKGSTMLDCIYNQTTKIFYVLDLICWKGHDFTNCDTQFRRFWLQSKFAEMPELTASSGAHKFALSPLPHIECRYDALTAFMATPSAFADDEPMEEEEEEEGGVATPRSTPPPRLDGLLFYHGDAFYEPGHTPLVGWLKPFMLPDLLGVPVAHAYLQQRPSDYTTLQAHIDASKRNKHNWWTKKTRVRDTPS